MTVATQPMTAEDLLNLPGGPWRYELILGELHRMSPAGHTHGKVAMRIGSSLGAFVSENGLGETYAAETGFILHRNPDTVRAPDAAFVSKEHLQRMTLDDAGFFPEAPDVAVEVLSPSDNLREVRLKIAEWLNSGSQAALLIDPVRRTASIHRKGRDEILLGETDLLTLPDLLPGWSVPLKMIFA